MTRKRVPNPESRAKAPPCVLSVETAAASPVTLGVVLLLGMVLVGAIGYVFSEIKAVREEIHKVEVEQRAANGDVGAVLSRLEERIENFRHQVPASNHAGATTAQ